MLIPLSTISASYSREYPYWIDASSGNGNTNGRVITTDSNGNIYVVGLTYYGTELLFTVYNKAGDTLVKRRITGGSNYNVVSAIVLDGLGNVYISGTKNGNVGGGYRPVLIKLGTDGSYKWSRTVYSSAGSYEYGCSVCVDNSGNPYIHVAALIGGYWTSCLVKYDASGSIQWQKNVGQTTSGDFVGGITLLPDGKIAIANGDAGTGNPYPSLVYVDTDGSLVSKLVLKSTTGNSPLYFYSVKIGSDGSRYALTQRTMDIGGGQYYSAPTIVKYLPGSNIPSWVRSVGFSGRYLFSTSNSIDLDSSDNVYLSSQTSSGSPGYSILAKYSSSGTLAWKRMLSSTPGTSSISISSVHVGENNVVYISGMLREGNTNNALTLALPADGSGTGNYSTGITDISYFDSSSITTPSANDYVNIAPAVAGISNSALLDWSETTAVVYPPSQVPLKRIRTEIHP